MENSKVWMIIGAAEGLGPAAVHYLLSKQQTIIAVLKDKAENLEIHTDNSGVLYLVYFRENNDSSFIAMIESIVAMHGKIDLLISNLAYSLLDDIKAKGTDKAKNIIEASVLQNGSFIRAIISFVKKEPDSRLIHLPPRFCAVEETDPKRRSFIKSALDKYLRALAEELSCLDIRIRFIEHLQENIF